MQVFVVKAGAKQFSDVLWQTLEWWLDRRRCCYFWEATRVPSGRLGRPWLFALPVLTMIQDNLKQCETPVEDGEKAADESIIGSQWQLFLCHSKSCLPPHQSWPVASASGPIWSIRRGRGGDAWQLRGSCCIEFLFESFQSKHFGYTWLHM